MRPQTLAILAACGLVFGCAGASAQCPDWQSMPFGSNGGSTGADGFVDALVAWDPDGAGGPRQPMLVAGGSFRTMFGDSVHYIAARDPETGRWQSLGGGMNDQVRALAVYDGELFAGGMFTQAGGREVNHMARWDGSAWQRLGPGPNLEVHALTVFNGELIAGGYFTTTGNVAANHIARWNGSTWAALGSGVDDWVVSLGVWNGELFAGGYFTNAGGVSANGVARWNGSSWQALSSGTNGEVTGFGVFSGGIAAGGRFTSAGGLAANNVARWDGAWHTMGTGMDHPVVNFGNFNGELIAGGAFQSAGGTPAVGVARWNGSSWAALDLGLIGAAYSFYPYNGELIVGGGFQEAGAQPALNIASWNGLEWGTLGAGAGNSVQAMTMFGGRVIAGGDFHQSTPQGPPAHFLVGWNGASFNPYGTSMDGAVVALEAHKYPGPFGASELVAGGLFTHAGGVAANRIARWTQPALGLPPASWEAMGAGFNGLVRTIERHAGATYAGGDFTVSSTAVSHVARWNETTDTWEALGAGMNGVVFALRSYGGSLYAGGSFTSAGGVSTGGLARWDGTAWNAVGGFFLGTVYALEVHDGQLVMAGAFTGLPGSPNIAQWNGSSYSTLGTGGTNGAVRSLESTPGRLYVGGEFTAAAGVSAPYIASWDGSWHAVPDGPDYFVYGMVAFNGELHAGGPFGLIHGTTPSPHWARYSETGVPWIAVQPSNQTSAPGGTVTLGATPAAGYGPLALQWYRFDTPLADGATGNGSSIGGATTGALTISNIVNTDYGEYSLRATNACGTGTSAVARVTPSGTAAGPEPAAGLGTWFEAIGPNPARGAAQLTFALARRSAVRFAVHDVAGRLVRDLAAGSLASGRHQARWDGLDDHGRRVDAGLYFVAFEVDGRRVAVRRLAMLR